MISSVSAFANLTTANLLADGFSETTTTNLLNDSSIQTVDISTSSIINYVIVAADLTPERGEYDYFKVNAITAIDKSIPQVAGALDFVLVCRWYRGLRGFFGRRKVSKAKV